MEIVKKLEHYSSVLDRLFDVTLSSNTTVMSRSDLNGNYTEVHPGIFERRIKARNKVKDEEKAVLKFLADDDFADGKVYVEKAAAGSSTPNQVLAEFQEITVISGSVKELNSNKVIRKGEKLNIPAMKEHCLFYPVDSLILIKISYDTHTI